MSTHNRRTFVGSMLAGAGAATLARGQVAAQGEGAAAAPADDGLVALGRTGVRVSILGLGTGVHGWQQTSNATRMGGDVYLPIMRDCVERGVTFFDLADLYGTHDFMRQLLTEVPREKLQIQSKIWFMGNGVPEKLTDARATVQRFLEETGAEYLDSLLLHCTGDADWNEKLAPHMERLVECREEGLVRALGTSCHSLPALQTALADPWVQIVQARINHTGSKMDGKPDDIAALLREMRAAGKGVIGMKLVGEGDYQDAETREAALAWVLRENCVDAMVIGFEATEHIDEAVANVNRIRAAMV
ncbi:MAG TPA: aldo/keto reductase [Armatimonadetes bacterium]|nr:aldo/keto reductase [Armatimonadota bacterium]